MTREFEVGVRLTADGKALVGETQAAKNAIDGLGNAAKKTGSEFGQASAQNNAYAGSLQQLKTGIIGVVSALGLVKVGQMAKEAAELSQRYGELGIAMHAVGRNAGLSAAEIDAQAKAVQRSGISMIESRSIISRLITANIDLSKATQLARSAQDAAVIGQINSSEALDRMVHGIIAAEVEVLRGIGINVSFENSYKKMAEQLGITTAELSENQKMQARVNVVLEEGAKNAGVYEAAMGNAGKMMRSTERLAEDLQVKIGGLFDQAMMLGVTTYTNLLKFLNQTIDDLTTSGAIERWGDNIARAFAFVMDLGRGVISLFKAIGLGIATTVEQAAALMSFDFDRVAALDKSYSQFLANERQGLTKNLDLVEEQIKARKNLAAVTNDSAKAITNEAGAIGNSNDGIRQGLGVRKQQVSEADKFIASLIKETESLGKNKFELLRLEAAKLGILDTTGKLIDKLEAETRALDDQSEAVRQREEDLRRIAQVTESVATAEEKYASRVRELDGLLSKGLGQEAYNRALKQAEEQFLKTGNTGRDALDEISQYSIQAQRNLQNALGDALFDGIDGRFNDMVDGFERAIQQMLAQALAADIWGALFNKRGGNTAALFNALMPSGGAGGGSGSLLNLASLGSNVASLFSTGLGATGIAGSALSAAGSFVGSGSTAAFGAGLAGDLIGGVAAGVEAGMSGAAAASAASLGSSIASVAGPAIALFAVDQIGRFLAGDKSTGTFVDMLPVVGGFAAALFGRGPLKQKETNLIGDITASGFSGITSTKWKAQGGLARSDKVDRVMTDTDSGELLNRYGELVEGGISSVLEPFAEQAKGYAIKLGKFLDENIGNISESVIDMSKTLGIGANALDGFSMSVNIASEKGKALTDEQIGQVLADAGEQMARTVVPQIDAMARNGETAYQTLQRITGEFNVLVSVGSALGHSLADTKAFLQGVAIEDRSAFINRAGGADALAQNIAAFSQNYLTEAERLAPVIETVTDKMAELGLEGIETKEQFRDLVQSQDLATESGQRMFLELMNIQGAFFMVANAAETAGTAAESLIPKLNASGLLNDAFSMLQRSVDAERKTVIKNYNDSLKAISTEIDQVTNNISKLKSLSDGLKATVASIRGVSISDARQQITAAIAAARRGRFPELDSIQPALQALQGQTTFGFRTREEFERARAANANLVAELGNLTDEELDSQQRMLGELERSRRILQDGFDREMARLDGILDASRQEVDALLGLNTTLLDLTAAIRNFNLAKNTVVDSGGAVTNPAMVLGGAGNSTISAQEIRDYINSGKTGDQILQAALQYNVSAQQIADAMKGNADFTMDNIRKFTASRGITGFASGGFHSGGVRIVGELGPELEMTGPSRIYSNQQTRDLLGSDQIVEAIKELTNAVNDDIKHNKQTADLLLRVTRDGESLRTVAA